MAYYLHATLVTVLETRDRPNFIQMACHHSAVLLLLSVSHFVQNNTRYGTVAGWLHDVVDVPVSVTRLTVDLPSAAPALVAYFTLLACFVFFRLVVYPRHVFLAAYECFASGVVKPQDAVGWLVTTPLLAVLVILHVIWLYELIMMGMNFFRTGTRADTNESHTKKKQN